MSKHLLAPTTIRFFYAILRISAGLLLHPYQTMQSLLAAEQQFVWLTLLPSGVLALTTLVWRVAIVPAAKLYMPCTEVPFSLCEFLPLVGNVVTFFSMYWQLILFYLLYRFSLLKK